MMMNEINLYLGLLKKRNKKYFKKIYILIIVITEIFNNI